MGTGSGDIPEPPNLPDPHFCFCKKPRPFVKFPFGKCSIGGSKAIERDN